MKKVIVFGSFDILHEGHKHYLKEAKDHGDYLIVVIARDENIFRFKSRKPKHDEEYRLEQVKKLDFVDETFLGDNKDILKPIKELKPDVICLGYDQITISEDVLKKELEKLNIDAEIARAKSFNPEIYKSSKLK